MTNEEMTLKTKQALVNALKNAMKTKPFSKVTVSELIKACNINRKTFYYHFPNIYYLLKWMLEQEAIEVIKNFDLIENTEGAIRFVIDYADQNKYIINGALDSIGYEEIKCFFYKDLFSVFYDAISQGEEELEVRLDTSFKDFLSSFYTEAAAGLLVEWTKNRMTQDKEAILQDLLMIFKTSFPAILLAKGTPV